MKRLLLMFALGAFAQNQAWKPFAFVLGEWTGEGSGTEGTFSFQPDLDGKILVRKNHTKTPTGVHEDLMVVSRKSPAAPYRAVYWDNEGHVIDYTVAATADGKSLQFVSEAAPGEPRFRLTYAELGPGRVSIQFEIAPPGKPEAFANYLSGTARRK